MAKRRIRLTESMLHDIVRESVCNVLNEMEWPTYHVAANKRYKQGRDEDAKKLMRHAEAQFRKKHFGGDGPYVETNDGQRNKLDMQLTGDMGFLYDKRETLDDKPVKREEYAGHFFDDDGVASDRTIDGKLDNISDEYRRRKIQAGDDLMKHFRPRFNNDDGEEMPWHY